MQDRLPNGASVNRLWSDSKTELLAVFQYKNDAEEFAKFKLTQDNGRGWAGSSYVVSCSYSGRIEVFAASPLASAQRSD